MCDFLFYSYVYRGWQSSNTSFRAPYNGLYGEALPERGTFFRLYVYERVGILQDEQANWAKSSGVNDFVQKLPKRNYQTSI